MQNAPIRTLTFCGVWFILSKVFLRCRLCSNIFFSRNVSVCQSKHLCLQFYVNAGASHRQNIEYHFKKFLFHQFILESENLILSGFFAHRSLRFVYYSYQVITNQNSHQTKKNVLIKKMLHVLHKQRENFCSFRVPADANGHSRQGALV